MTMVHIATKAISRKSGQSAVACAAYRAGDVLYDDKYGKTHDYGKKSGVMSSDIILPCSLRAFGVNVYREMLWNTAEAAESRSDSRVAREWLINLPYELPEEDRYQLAINFAQKLCDDMNVIADVFIHQPVMKLPFDPDAKPSSKRLREGEENPDPRNFHAHIMVTTRAPIVGPNKTLAFDPKLKNPFEWSNKKRKAHNLPSSMQEIKRVREMWVDTANKVLAQYGLPLMDARSYQNQGLDQQPTIKIGVEATAMERRGIITEKGNTNRAIIARNKMVAEKNNQQRADNEQRTTSLRRGLAWTTQTNARLPILIGDTKQRADSTQRRISDTTSGIAWAAERCERIPNGIDTVNNRIKSADDGINWATDHTESLPKLIRDTEQLITNTKPNLEWTAERCENLPKWIDETDKRSERANKWITHNSKRATDSESIAQGIHQGITERAKPVPSPFDDNSRQARANRLTEQEGRFNRKSAEEDRGIESARERARLVRLIYVQKWLRRHKDSNRLRPGWHDSSDDYPDKLDYRQNDLLDAFAESLSLNKANDEYPRCYMERIVDTFDSTFITENKAAISILRDPKADREQYDAIKIHFDTFIKNLDEQREAIDNKTRGDLGNIGGVTRMTAQSISAPIYIQSLDSYINNAANEDMNRELAIEHRANTINRTCQQFKHSMIGLRDIQQADQRQTYSDALQGSLNIFIASYGKELSNDEQVAIKDGLSIAKQQVQSNSMKLRR